MCKLIVALLVALCLATPAQAAPRKITQVIIDPFGSGISSYMTADDGTIWWEGYSWTLGNDPNYDVSVAVSRFGITLAQLPSLPNGRAPLVLAPQTAGNAQTGVLLYAVATDGTFWLYKTVDPPPWFQTFFLLPGEWVQINRQLPDSE